MSTPCANPRALTRIPLSRIRIPPDRPRGQISRDSIDRLAESIRLHGLLSPLLVRQSKDRDYLLIAGERRLRALEALHLSHAEAILLTGSDCDCALIALVENLQRENLHFLDVAAACRRILDRYPITQEHLAASLSCSPSTLANRLRLLKLPESVQRAIRDGNLSERHARALLRLASEPEQLAMTEQAIQGQLSVAQLEKRVAQRLASPAPSPARAIPLLRDSRVVVNALMDTVRRLTRIGLPVQSRVEQSEGCVQVIVTIPAAGNVINLSKVH